jgi:hypothetical protein
MERMKQRYRWSFSEHEHTHGASIIVSFGSVHSTLMMFKRIAHEAPRAQTRAPSPRTTTIARACP